MSLFSSQKTEKRYITLKEAAALSGYSSDYVGQLIRSGKINGKRVYANPVWMTTEKDLLEYLEVNRSDGGEREKNGNKLLNVLRSWKTKVRSELELVKLYKGILYLTIGVSMLFSLFVFYVFSVNFDDWLSRRSTQDMTATAIETPVVNETVTTF